MQAAYFYPVKASLFEILWHKIVSKGIGEQRLDLYPETWYLRINQTQALEAILEHQFSKKRAIALWGNENKPIAFCTALTRRAPGSETPGVPASEI